MTERNVSVNFTAHDGVSAVMSDISNRFNQVEQSAGGASVSSIALGTALGGALTKAAELAMEAVKKLWEVFSRAFDEAQQDELLSMRLAQQVRNVGRETGVTNDFLAQMVTKYRDLAGGSDDVVKSTESVLLRFTNITRDIYPQALQLSADLAATMGTDMTSAAQMLGRALESPATGMMTLRRAGVVLDTAQQNMIKTLEKSGHTAQAQALLMSDLAGIVGGTAAAAANTLSGRWSILTNHMNDALKTIAEKLIPTVEQLINEYIMPAIPKIEMFAEAFSGYVVVALQVLLPIVQQTFTTLFQIVSTFGALMRGDYENAWTEILNFTSTIQAAIYMVVQQVWNSIFAGFIQNLFGIDTHMKGTFEEIKEVIRIQLQVGALWVEYYITKVIPDFFRSLPARVTGAWNDLKAGAEKAFTTMGTAIGVAFYDLKGQIADDLVTIRSKLATFWNDIRPIVENIINIISPILGPIFGGGITNTISNMLNSRYDDLAQTAAMWRSWKSDPTGGGMFRAAGGPVGAGQPYIVGERGPELFTPHASGWISPQVTNNYNYSPTYGQAMTPNEPASFNLFKAMVGAS